MNLRFVAYLLGWLLLVAAVFLCMPLAASLLFGEAPAPFLAAIALAGAAGLALVKVRPPADRHIRPRDGFLVVSGAWIAVSVLGAVPYLVAGTLGPVDALFESVSGFTTTGSTVIADTATVPDSLLLWRAETHWLGGMGILVLCVAILPLLGVGGMQIYRAEVAGPSKDRLTPRIQDTAKLLWGVYLLLSVIELGLLMAGIHPESQAA